jgi:hypothetical protein
MLKMFEILYCIKGDKELIIDRSKNPCPWIMDCLTDNGYVIYYKTSDGKRHKLHWWHNPVRYSR